MDGMGADQFAQVRAVGDQGVNGRAGKEQTELLEHFLPPRIPTSQ